MSGEHRESIWYVSKYVAPATNTSSGSRGYELMREVAALGHRCLIITSDANHLGEMPILKTPTLIEKRGQLDICWLRTMKFSKPKSFRRILSWLHFEYRLLLLRKRQFSSPDIIIASSLSLFTIITGIYLARRYRAKLIFEVRDIWPLTLVEEGGYRPRHPIIRLLGLIERVGYRRADLIVGTMPNLSAHVTEVLGAPRNVACIPMGFTERLPDGADLLTPEKLDLSLPPNRFIIGYAGSIGITNALDPLFQAALRMQDVADVHFLIVGDGPLLSSYKSSFGELPNVTFAPKVPKSAVQKVLARCDLLYLSVYASRVWEYGQSLNKLIDYMRSGKPIVASYSGFPSMIDEAGCGAYVRAGDVDALVAQFREWSSVDRPQLEAIGERGRNWVRLNRNYHALAGQYDRLFHSLF